MVDYTDTYELIRELYRINNPDDEDTDELRDDFLENYVYDYCCCEDFEKFYELIDDLLRFTPVLKSPLTGTLSHCFGVIEDKDTGLFRAIIKKDI
jgi:hypothetical protein